MDSKLWKHQCELIHAMDIIVRSFNDEEWTEPWLVYGVPDDANTIEDVMGVYPNDDEFADEFKQLQLLFVNLVAVQCMGKDGIINHSFAKHLLY